MMPPVREKMKRFTELVSFEAAGRMIHDTRWKPVDIEMIRVEDSIGKICADRILSISEVPLRPRSLVDGYAVRSSITAGASLDDPVIARIVGSVEAGCPSDQPAGDRECYEIFTGGAVPDGTDTVIMAEEVSATNRTITIPRYVPPGENISGSGEDIPSNFTIISRGEQIRSWHAGAMLSSGVHEVKTYRTLNLGIIATGNELFPESQDHVENTTGITIGSLLSTPFLSARSIGKVHDNQEEIRDAVLHGIREYDGLIISGGTSLGCLDEVPEAMDGISSVIFGGVRIRPGRTTTLYDIGGKPVFSVSGFPSTAMISADLFVESYMNSVTGIRDFRKSILLPLREGIQSRAGYLNLIPASVSTMEGRDYVTPVSHAGGMRLRNVLGSDGLLIIPENIEGYQEGEHATLRLW